MNERLVNYVFQQNSHLNQYKTIESEIESNYTLDDVLKT